MKLSSIPHPIEIILRTVGIWPNKSKLAAYLLICSLITFTLIFQFWDAVLVYRDIVSLMSSLCATTAESMFLIKFLIMRKKRGQITDIIKKIITDCKLIQTQKEENFVLESLRFSYSFFVCTALIYVSAAIFFVIVSATSYNTEKREFILESAYPFKADESPAFEIIFILQTFASVVTGLGNAFINGLYISMVMHVCVKIDILREEIKRFSTICTTSNDKRLTKSATKTLVDQYQDTICLSKEIEDVFSYQLFIQVILSTLEICATGLTFITLTEDNNSEHLGITKVMKFVMFFIAALWVTGVDCSGGDYLKRKSELIHQDIYSCIWYDYLQLTECRTIWMTMIRSEKPITITAGKFINMTLESFTNIIKTSVSYLSVLRAMR